MVEDVEVQVEADTDVRRRPLNGGLVEGRTEDGGDEEEARDD